MNVYGRAELIPQKQELRVDDSWFMNKVTVGLDGICWVITKWIANSTVASQSLSPFESRFAAKQEWLNGDEERVECAIHFVKTQQIPSKRTVTLFMN